MAAAPSPLPVQRDGQMNARKIQHLDVVEKQTTNPTLIVILIALVAYPFFVHFLPSVVVQHLDVLFH
jgi:hypothetical protein